MKYIGYVIHVIKSWFKWHKNWDELCNKCGKCCYARSVFTGGLVAVHYNSPCENLDTETHLCKIYKDRFKKCDHCGKVNLFVVLFNKTLPNDCAYVVEFRPWEKKRRNLTNNPSKKN